MQSLLVLLLGSASALVHVPLWLDLRGTPSGDEGMDKLLELFSGVRYRFNKACLPPPSGAAIAGVLHEAADVADDDDPEDGGLSLLVLRDGELWSDGRHAGAAISVVAGKSKEQATAAAYEAISIPEANVALLGDEPESVLELFGVALAQAQHCRSISGSETRLLCECADPGTVEAIRRAASEDKVGVPCAALLRCNADLWFEALRDAL